MYWRRKARLGFPRLSSLFVLRTRSDFGTGFPSTRRTRSDFGTAFAQYGLRSDFRYGVSVDEASTGRTIGKDELAKRAECLVLRVNVICVIIGIFNSSICDKFVCSHY